MSLKKIATRQSFGEAILQLGFDDPKILVLDADLSKSTCTAEFAEKIPAQSFQMGISEANMLGVAAGLSLSGFKPFACSFAAFIAGRFDTIKMSISYAAAPVCIVGTHAGVGIGPDGYSQQGLEDIALMRTLHNVTVLQPADNNETKAMVKWLSANPRPAYLRLTRQPLRQITSENEPFVPGKFGMIAEGTDVAIFATGGCVEHALEASETLKEKGVSVRVYNASCIAPLDEQAIVRAAKECGFLMSVEDHTVQGGLGGAIAEILCEQHPQKLMRLGIRNDFGESGEAVELYAKHEIDAAGIIKNIQAGL